MILLLNLALIYNNIIYIILATWGNEIDLMSVLQQLPIYTTYFTSFKALFWSPRVNILSLIFKAEGR